jgi:hypothetical protein
LLRTTFTSDVPEIVVNNHDTERSEFRIIDARDTSRPDDLWGRPETEGTLRKRSYNGPEKKVGGSGRESSRHSDGRNAALIRNLARGNLYPKRSAIARTRLVWVSAMSCLSLKKCKLHITYSGSAPPDRSGQESPVKFSSTFKHPVDLPKAQLAVPGKRFGGNSPGHLRIALAAGFNAWDAF